MFDNVPDNVVICINEDKTNNTIFSQIRNKTCYNIDCTNNWKSGQKKIIQGTNTCVDNCQNTLQYKYEYNGKCYENCSNGYILDNNIYKCKCELEKCLTCPQEALNKNLCTKCNNNYYEMENEPSNIGEYINCYKEVKGYYLDKNDSLFKKCYDTCETCEVKGDNITHNCLKCKTNYTFEIKNNNYSNCYENCSYYYYFDNENFYHCTFNLSCPNEYPLLLHDKNECVKVKLNKYETNIINYEKITTSEIEKVKIPITAEKMEIIITPDYFDNMIEDISTKYKKNYTLEEMTPQEEIDYYNDIIRNIEAIFTDKNFDTKNLDIGLEKVIKKGKITITLATTQSQKNKTSDNYNMTIIDLGNCEKDLRGFYNISEDEMIYIKKMDVIQEGMKTTKVDYNLYCKLNGTNLIRLNKSICENSKISISIPIDLSDNNIDTLNQSSDYFNNICYKSKSDSRTDIPLKDRQKEFVEGNKTICQEDCLFADYNHSTSTANCSCSNAYENMKINNSKLYENFGDTNNKKDFSNLGVTTCDVTENIESNTGFYLLLVILIIFIIIFILFCTKGYSLLENEIDGVIHKKFKNDIKKKSDKLQNTLVEESKNKSILKSKNAKKNKQSKSIKVEANHKSRKKIKLNKGNIDNKKSNHNSSNKNSFSIFQNNINKNQNTKEQKFKPDTDYELNWLSYQDALKYDKRENCDYYGSLLKSKQLFLFTFCSFNDYNSGIIKKFMLFLSFALHYTANALFFTESNMHQIYEDKGKFNFGYQVSFILYSAIISTFILRIMLRTLVLTDKDVLEVKQQETKPLAIIMKKQKLKNIKIKYMIFFILNFLLLTLFWYYLTCFNGVYENTQVYLIENTFISFGFSLFYPFIINIFPTLIRSCAIHSSDKNQEYLYKFSQVIQVI